MAKRDTKEEMEFQFLLDGPEEEDGFSGKGHERSARALSNAIRKFSDDDRSIGLEGSWGSGKTTVVTIAQKELERDHPGKFVFYTFDLWSNQGIDFRRAFLEGFLDWSKAYVSNKPYKDVAKRIQGKTKTIETDSERQFSVFGYIVICALFFLPFLALWLSPFAANLHRAVPDAAATDNVQNDLPWVFRALMEYGHWMALIILGIVAFSFVLQTIGSWCSKGTLRQALDASFSLLTRKSEKDTITQTIRDGDPTQYEFHKLFSELLSLVQGSGRRVVFVLDNIDRLPAELIQEAWANVRTIFSKNSNGQTSPSNMVTAVVPYDRSHVLSSLKASGDSSSGKSEEGKNATQSTYAREDLFRKVFSAIVTVSPPVTSDVQSFFEACLKQALPNQLNERQRYRVFNILDTFLTGNAVNPTPRQVKSFINDFGLLWHQWRGSISIEAIAIFVLHRSKLESDPKSLQDPNTIGARYRRFASEEPLDRELAALAYNVEPNVALEVLLERDIVAALQRGGDGGLDELAASPGFAIQLDRILDEHCSQWASTSILEFGTALENYCKLSLDPSVKEHSDKHFTDSILKLTKINLEEHESYESLFHIAHCIPKEALVTQYRRLTGWVKSGLPEELTHELGRAWIAFVGGLLNGVEEVHGRDAAREVTSKIAIPYSPNFYLGVALDCDTVELHLADFENVAASKGAELASALIEFGKGTPDHFSYVWKELQFALKQAERASVFTALLQEFQGQLLDGSGQRNSYFGNLVAVAARCRSEKSVIKQLRAALSDGSLAWHALKANEANDTDSLADSIWLAALASGTDELPTLSTDNRPPFGDLSQAHNWFMSFYKKDDISDPLLNAVVQRVTEHGSTDSWLKNFAKSPSQAIHRDVLTKMLSKEDCPAISIGTLTEAYPTLKTHFADEDVAQMVGRVGGSLTTETIEGFDLSNFPPQLLADIGDRTEEAWNALAGRVDQHLKSLTSADWKDALVNDTHNRRLLFARGQKLEGKIPPNSLRTPLSEFVEDLLVSKGAPSESLDGHSAFCLALSASSRKGVSQDVFDRIADKPVAAEGIRTAITAFPDLISELPLENRPETAILKVLIPLLEGGIDTALERIRLTPDVWSRCVANASQEVKAQLNDYIPDDSEDEAVQANAAELRKLLKLRKPRKKPDTNEKIEEGGAQQ